MPTAYEKLSALLKELFQIDQADLGFRFSLLVVVYSLSISNLE
jgi:hypothetical protein